MLHLDFKLNEINNMSSTLGCQYQSILQKSWPLQALICLILVKLNWTFISLIKLIMTFECCSIPTICSNNRSKRQCLSIFSALSPEWHRLVGYRAKQHKNPFSYTRLCQKLWLCCLRITVKHETRLYFHLHADAVWCLQWVLCYINNFLLV